MKHFKLKQHQRIPISYMKQHRALLLYHSTGSGKTITALMAVLQHTRDIIIVGPKSSKKAFMDDIKKFKLNANRITIYTYQKVKLLLETNFELFTDKSVILDEAHYLRNETLNNLTIIAALKFAYKIILLTATPVINYPNDIAVLVNIVKNNDVLPTDMSMFNNMYYDEEEIQLRNQHTLAEKMQGAISYYKNNTSKHYPSFKILTKKIEMNNEQLVEYANYIKKFLFDKELVVAHETITNIYNVDFALFNRKKRNFFLNATRQLSNTIKGSSEFPKIQQIFKTLMEGNFPAVIYSNFLKNGVYALAYLLEKHDISYKTITGSTHSAKLNNIVTRYNNGEIKVLLLSSAGSESLDLKNTRQVHIMEPHWNEAKIKQVIGRTIRYLSHKSLPKDQQNVVIYRWISVFPSSVLNKSADEYLLDLSKKKDEVFQLYDDLIKSVSIEANKHSNMNGGLKQSFKALELCSNGCNRVARVEEALLPFNSCKNDYYYLRLC